MQGEIILVAELKLPNLKCKGGPPGCSTRTNIHIKGVTDEPVLTFSNL